MKLLANNALFAFLSFLFLAWYLPFAVKDGMVTGTELFVIVVNFLSFLWNFYRVITKVMEASISKKS